jgi:predicted anti-sigma-YlaC factor YlaD
MTKHANTAGRAIRRGFFAAFAAAAFLSSCAIDKLAVNMISDSLTGSGSATAFTGDDDPVMVADALPAFLKLYETLLSMNPEHVGLMRTTGSLLVMYANAFVAGPADYYPVERVEEKLAANVRAGRMYIKGRNLEIKALEKEYPGIAKALLHSGRPGDRGDTTKGELAPFLAKLTKKDVPTLYWLVSGWFGAMSLDNMNIEISMRIGNALACLNRAYQLDPDYEKGSLDELYIQILAALPPDMGGDRQGAESHFQRALKLADGTSAGAYVAWGGSVLMNEQRRDDFVAAMNQALAVNLDKDPNRRLVNVLNQERARYWLKNIDDYFLPVGE